MSSLFVASEDAAANVPLIVGTTGPALLALYETVYLSPNFVTMLTHTQLLSRPAPVCDVSGPAGSYVVTKE
jgi:hypothetical protein